MDLLQKSQRSAPAYRQRKHSRCPAKPYIPAKAGFVFALCPWLFNRRSRREAGQQRKKYPQAEKYPEIFIGKGKITIENSNITNLFKNRISQWVKYSEYLCHLYPMYGFLLFCHNKRSSYDLDFTIEEPLQLHIYRKSFTLPSMTSWCRMAGSISFLPQMPA